MDDTFQLAFEMEVTKFSLKEKHRAIEGSEQALFNIVSSDYFKTVGMPLLQGRALMRKILPASKKVAIVNEAMAKRYWPAENPLGKKFRFDTCGIQIQSKLLAL